MNLERKTPHFVLRSAPNGVGRKRTTIIMYNKDCGFIFKIKPRSFRYYNTYEWFGIHPVITVK